MEGSTLTGFVIALALCAVVVVAQVICTALGYINQAAAF